MKRSISGKKLTLCLLLALVAGLGVAAVVSAGPRGMGGMGMCMDMGMGMGRGMMGRLTPAQAGELFDLRQKFLNDTAELRKQMVVKRAEMGALWRSDNPDEKQILAKQKEIGALKDKFQEKMVPFRLQARKIAPPPAKTSLEQGPGFGRHMEMAGCGMGGPGMDW